MLRKRGNEMLTRMEQVAHTDVRYLLRNTSWLFFNQVTLTISGIILTAAYANLVDPQTFGMFRYVIAVSALFGVFTLPGITTALARAISLGAQNVLGTLFIHRVKWSLLGSIAALCMAIYYYLTGMTAFAIAFAAVSVFLPFFDPVQIYSAYYSGKKDFRRASTLTAYAHIIGSIGVFLALFISTSLFALVVSYFGFYVLAHGFFLYRTIKRDECVADIPVDRIQEIRSFGFHLSIQHGMFLIANHLDKILLFYFLDPIQVAVYTIALALPEQLKNVVRNIGTIALPKFVERSISEIQKTIWRRLFLFGSVIVALVFIYIVCAPVLFEILFPAYMEGIFVSQLLSLTVIGSVAIIPTAVMKAHLLTKELYINQTIVHATQTALFILLIPIFGILGAVYARLVTRGLHLILTLYFLKSQE